MKFATAYVTPRMFRKLGKLVKTYYELYWNTERNFETMRNWNRVNFCAGYVILY